MLIPFRFMSDGSIEANLTGDIVFIYYILAIGFMVILAGVAEKWITPD